YRTKEELLKWKSRDALEVFRKKSGLDDSVVQEIVREVEREIDEAVHYARESPDPDVAEVLDELYS
ncbi:MAG TPA: pyruvate dehydrogenase (acetyl-transferring) E1 component subunit alpha, partial [Spirochaetia bacterium]|nr:pyruvate dehydrogenase (acetyl-transferring) E1 component subunit alpha [Spirochaetia bacterium]